MIQLSANSSTENILGIVKIFNSDPTVHGILVQLPLPRHVNEETVLSAVDIDKDVDGFHASNMGNLAMERRTPLFTPCTPLGCLRLIDEYKIPLQGKCGCDWEKQYCRLPISLMMMKRNATVTVCNAYGRSSRDNATSRHYCFCVCQAQMVRGDWVKEGVVVIDIGINHIQDPEHPDKPEKKKMVGDIHYEEVSEKASHITPVPGGVGPMTVAMLMENTYRAFIRQERN